MVVVIVVVVVIRAAALKKDVHAAADIDGELVRLGDLVCMFVVGAGPPGWVVELVVPFEGGETEGFGGVGADGCAEARVVEVRREDRAEVVVVDGFVRYVEFLTRGEGEGGCPDGFPQFEVLE